MDAVKTTRFDSSRRDEDDVSESSDTCDNYEDLEARLQQERIDYLQTLRKREMEDAATARQMMQDELLQIEREKLCHVMQDEELARRLQAEERKDQLTTQPTSVHDELNVFLSSSESDSDEEDVRGTDFNNAVYFTGDPAAAAVDTTRNDEMLARALQQSEQEAARRRAQDVDRLTGDAYLARIIQNTERISAVRRHYVTQNTQQPAAITPQRHVSVPGDTTSQGAEMSSSAEGASVRRSRSATDDLSRVGVGEDPATTRTSGAQGIATTSAAGAEGSATSTPAAQGGVTSTGAKRTKSAARKGGCKQQ